MGLSVGITASTGRDSGNSTVLTFGTSTAGSNVAVVLAGESTVTTLTDNDSNTYVEVAGSRVQVDMSGYSTEVSTYVAHNINGRAGHTITVTSTGGFFSVLAAEVIGPATSASNENSAARSDTTEPQQSGGITTTTNDVIMIGGCIHDSASSGSNFTSGNSFTLQEELTDGSSEWVSCLVTRIVSSTSTYDVSLTNAVNADALVNLIDMKIAAVGGVSKLVVLNRHRGI